MNHRSIRPLFILSLTGALLLCYYVAYAGYAWWSVQSVPTHRHGILACHAEDAAAFSFTDLASMPDGSMRPRDDFELAQALLQSNNPNYRTVGVVAFSAEADKHEQLLALANAYPDNSLAALHVLKSCFVRTRNSTTPTGCGIETATKVLELERENAFALGLVANYQFAINQEVAAYQTMRQVAEASRYESYFLQQFEVLDSQRDQLTTTRAPHIDFNLLDYALDASLTDHRYGDYCEANVAANPQLVPLCASLFENMVEQSDTLIHEMLGWAWQQSAYSKSGNDTEASRIEAVAAERRASLRAYSSSGGSEAVLLGFYDNDLTDRWLSNFIQFGERYAYEAMISDAREKSASDDYRPCDPTGLRFEFPFFYVGDALIEIGWY